MIGHFSLFVAWVSALASIILGFVGANKKQPRMVLAARNCLNLVAIFGLISLVFLAKDFVTHNYSNLYVWQHSSNEMPTHYLVSAIWGGMDGSMLLWAVIMAIFSASAVNLQAKLPRQLISYVIPVLAIGSCFFFSVVLFLTNPFRLVPGSVVQTNGNGLNPLLQNPSMMIHPPLLYLGFTGFVVPFAYCVAALLSSELGTAWIGAVRKWTLLSWTFLTAGIILGGNWAYIELGWGGFWAWDPVENASFMPWLSGTAFLHSVMVQEHRGMLKKWNVFLASLTYLLTVFGTFLTRSGVVQSVHAFAETDVGWVFLAYLAGMATFIGSLLFIRRESLRTENVIVSYLSREAAFLFNNLALLGILFVTLWGVMLPVISEAITGEKLVVGPPFFDRVNNPLFLFLIFLMAVGPLISWRKSSFNQVKKLFIRPFILSAFVFTFLIFIDSSRILTALSFSLAFFVISSVLLEFYKASKLRARSNATSAFKEAKTLLVHKRRKYAAHLIHIAVALAVISITASSSYKIERDIALSKGESTNVGRYKLQLDEIKQGQTEEFGFLQSVISVYHQESGDFITKLLPEKRIYGKNQEVTTEVDIESGMIEDLYIALAGLEHAEVKDPKTEGDQGVVAIFKVFVNPLQVWLWFSSMLMLVGAVILIFDQTRNFNDVSTS